MQILFVIAAILVGLWFIGLIIHLGGILIHALLILAIIAVLIRVIQGRPVL